MKDRTTIRQKLGSPAILVMADQSLVSGFTFLLTFLSARLLPVNAFSLFASVVLVQLLLLAIQQSLVTSPWQVLHQGLNMPQKAAYVRLLLWLQGALMVLITLVALVLYCFIPAGLAEWRSLHGWILLSVLTSLLQDHLRRMFLADGATGLALLTDLFVIGPQIILLAVVALAGQYSLRWLFLATGIGPVPALVGGLLKLPMQSAGRTATRHLVQVHCRQAKWLLGTTLLQWWAGNAFIVTAGIVLGAAAFAAIRLAQSLFGVVNVIFQAFENHVVPKAGCVYRDTPGCLGAYVRKAAFRAGWLIVPLLLAVMITARPLFTFFGGEAYGAYSVILQGMALLYLFIFIGYPVRVAIRVLLLNRAFFNGYVLTTLFSVAAAGIMVRTWNIYGVLAGLLLNQWIATVYWSWVLYKKNLPIWK